VGAMDFSRQESQQRLHAIPPPSCNPVLIDPLDKLAASCKVTVYDLINALRPTHEEVHLIQEMSIGQHSNSLLIDARQWRIASSNFGKVCNRQFRQSYPPSLIKSLLENYGVPYTAPIQWRNKGDAISSYKSKSHSECGIFLSTDYQHSSVTLLSRRKSTCILSVCI